MKRGTSAERDQLSSAVEVLTSDEQDRVIQELHDTMAAQNRTIRLAFGVIFCFVAAIYCFCLLAFLHEPWSLVHQQRFEFTVAPSLLMSYYAISCAVFVVAALVCQVSSSYAK